MIAAGIPAERIDSTLQMLGSHGLMRQTGADTWEAMPPDLVLPALASVFEARATYMRDAADALAHVYRTTRLPEMADRQGVTILRNNEELGTAIQVVSGAARTELWAAYDDSPFTSHLFGNDLAWHRERPLTRDGSPPQRRTTFDTEMLHHEHASAVLMARAESGEDNRFLAGIPFSVMVADDACAVVDLTSFDTSGAGSLMVRDRRIVLALRGLCETWWRLGTPLAWESGGELDEDSSFIVSMLAAGATDAMMASQAGLSQRTVERRVRALMNRLGATTRFQAGVLAVRRGWI